MRRGSRSGRRAGMERKFTVGTLEVDELLLPKVLKAVVGTIAFTRGVSRPATLHVAEDLQAELGISFPWDKSNGYLQEAVEKAAEKVKKRGPPEREENGVTVHVKFGRRQKQKKTWEMNVLEKWEIPIRLLPAQFGEQRLANMTKLRDDVEKLLFDVLDEVEIDEPGAKFSHIPPPIDGEAPSEPLNIEVEVPDNKPKKHGFFGAIKDLFR
uniref:Uncharacterized protein n=1 Tax=Palpitomonas bilix TaxID=652834 RepID=A0A7S3G4X8_9EUKA|mmetsp:Transcript_19391/g.49707  ORF Transcript_19391/g.49707 Transcript_19391/m.49707 type:complete len:211 (+) Transcript_19391:281-913(+)|eukprot:CAMPEP_0113900802 /NCGR_PEP_ID=MMETSP0780_2-20120614/20886_1 /TAXON_ID=652834 /ORGANISM="Palpitomonas bilix" /LENGTH=210 /DNA_ID=CAMNT_0000893315 /DNA_START=276 /DNA_END=908 /DNA_ORIENTATION=+ /assembly_acc=CAM_ASM_000599